MLSTDEIIAAVNAGENQNWSQLLSMGREAWNTWAQSNLETQKITVIDFNRHADVFLKSAMPEFKGYDFPCKLRFDGIQSDKLVAFSECKFHSSFELINTETHLSIHIHKCEISGIFSLDLSTLKGEFSSFETRYLTTFSATESHFEKHLRFFDNEVVGTTNFSKSTFGSSANFIKSRFLDEAFISDLIFKNREDQEALFNRCIFKGPVFFTNSKFPRTTNFYTAIFENTVSFEQADFGTGTPNFNVTSFSSNHSPSIRGIKLSYPISPNANRLEKALDKCALPDGEDRYRALKNIAISNKDYDEELRFFALEMKAKRFHSYNISSARGIVNVLYEATSDFGRSIRKPLIGLLWTFAISWFAYSVFFAVSKSGRLFFAHEWISSTVSATLINLVPFTGQVATGREAMTAQLCDYTVKSTKNICLGYLYGVSAIEGIFAFTFLFLLGLAIRNVARIK